MPAARYAALDNTPGDSRRARAALPHSVIDLSACLPASLSAATSRARPWPRSLAARCLDEARRLLLHSGRRHCAELDALLRGVGGGGGEQHGAARFVLSDPLLARHRGDAQRLPGQHGAVQVLAREGIVAAPQPEELSRAEGSSGQLDGEGDAAADVNVLLRLVARLGWERGVCAEKRVCGGCEANVKRV